jgi:hypothetical protein
METPKRPKRQKRPIDIHIDTKNVDVDIQRDSEGNVKIDVDTKKVDIHFKKEEGIRTLDIEIDDSKEYEFESSGSKHMPKGTIWKISGEMLKIFLQKGLGKLIK